MFTTQLFINNNDGNDMNPVTGRDGADSFCHWKHV